MKKAAFTCSKRFHIILFLVLSFFVEHNAWAQTDYSGTYYIVNHRISTNPNINYSGSTSNADKFFLVPAQTPQQIDKTDVYYDADHPWKRINSVQELKTGDQIIIAARYDNDNSHYYAMPATPTGQPAGVSFTSVSSEGYDWLPDAITNSANTYLWTVDISGSIIKLTNNSSITLGCGASNNFVTTGTNDTWTITRGTAGNNAPVPSYTGFLLTNVGRPAMGVAFQKQGGDNEFGPFATSNYNSSNYNFYLDIFVRHTTSTYREPYITTFRTNGDENSIWNIAKTADDYYTIQHIQSGSFLVYARAYPNSTDPDQILRKVVHLEATNNPGETAKFHIDSYEDKIIIRPKSLTGGTGDDIFLNVHKGNQPNYWGTDSRYDYAKGLIALYRYPDDYTYWHFEDVVVPDAPSISYDNNEEKVMITHTNIPAEDFTIYYTTNGTNPTSASSAGSEINHPGPCTVKAIVIKNDNALPSAITIFELEQVATPTVSFTNNTVVLACSTSGATIQYKTATSATWSTYSTPLTDAIAGKQLVVRAKKDQMINSEPLNIPQSQFQKVADPVFDTISNTITIACATSGANIFFTTDGSNPSVILDNGEYVPGNGTTYQYTSALNYLYSSLTIKAIAMKVGVAPAGWFNSNITSGSYILKCPPPVITPDYDSGLITLSCDNPGAEIYYTTNGLTPDPSHVGPSYPTKRYSTTGPFYMTGSGTVKAIATKDGCIDSKIVQMELQQVAAPVLTFTNVLTITCPTDGTSISYSLDGGSNWNAYTAPISGSLGSIELGVTTIMVKTTNVGLLPYVSSPLVLNKAATPVIAEDGNNRIAITCATGGAVIRFSTDNQISPFDPAANDYEGPLGRDSYSGVYWNDLISNNGLYIAAFAQKDNMFWSDPVTSEHAKLYTLVPTIDISTGQIIITIPTLPSDPDYTYNIRYTTQGTEPTITSTLYDPLNPVTLSNGGIIQAKGQRGTFLSAVSEAVSVTKVMDPVIRDNGDNHISFATAEPGAIIYFTTDGTNPDVTWNSGTLSFDVVGTAVEYDPINNPNHPLDYSYSGKTIKAVAVKGGMLNSNTITGTITLRYPQPSISINPANGEIILSDNCRAATFYGIPVEGSALQGYSFTNLASIDGVQRNFLPKIQFDYNDGDDKTVLIYGETSAVNNYVPTYDYFANAYLRTQFVIPADTLEDMNGSSIGKITFYLSSSAIDNWSDDTYNIYVKKVANTNISSFIDPATATQVYSGTLDATGNELVVTFATPYSFTGGSGHNLLIGIDRTTATSNGTQFYYTSDGTNPTTTPPAYDPSDPFAIYNPATAYSAAATTVKAIATHTGWNNSSVTTQSFYQVMTPEVTPNSSNNIEITCETQDAHIFYTTNDDDPVVVLNAEGQCVPGNANTKDYSTTGALSGTTYTNSTIKAVAVKDGWIPSPLKVSPGPHITCKKPTINRYGNDVVITKGNFPDPALVPVTIYYTMTKNTNTDPVDPITYNPNGSLASVHGDAIAYSGALDLETIFTDSENNFEYVKIKAVAVATDYNPSEITAIKKIVEGLEFEGTAPDITYKITHDGDLDMFVYMANHDGNGYHYRLDANVSAAGIDRISAQSFSGVLESSVNADGIYYTISDLTHPLINTIDGGTVKNIMFKNVHIEQEGNVGAICCEATGAARIYNCGILPSDPANTTPSTLGSANANCGGLVGLLNGTARVINSFSYANITSGTVKAGIVGYNNVATTYTNIQTMVMNCMFYGDINAAGGGVYPVYGGTEISNDYTANNSNRLNNYNYFLYEAPFSKNNHNGTIFTTYNCALAAEERFLVRFEFYRHLLNSNRELATWYVTGEHPDAYTTMSKWVLDKAIAPYPILKAYSCTNYPNGKYPSVVNYDKTYTFNPETGEKVTRASVSTRNQGGIVTTLGTSGSLTINIQMGDGAKFNRPDGATITTESVICPIIDKDTAQYNFNYGKVQLPYYNEVGTKNYTGNRVVTGWKIVSMVGGISGGYTETNYDAPNYNFADRDHIGKDIYTSGTGNSGRIYAQGAYFNVPTGVTSITIQPYWANCAYLSDAYYDRYGYNTTDDLAAVGGVRYNTNNSSTITINGSSQTVYTTFAGARDAMGSSYSSGATVYDYAVVLVGNYHHHTDENPKKSTELSNVTSKPLTVTSVDLNKDNEPDYCIIYRSGKQNKICPIRYDFITLPSMAMAQKMKTNNNLAIPGNCTPSGWFEITTTALIKFGQFEHSANGKTNAPVIFMGGVIDQFVTNNQAGTDGDQPDYNNRTKYMLFGDNVWFKMLSNGTHADNVSATPHRPISITGGEFETLYLSGYFRPDANPCTAENGDNNAECYIDGGVFGEVAGAGQELIDGDVTWNINHADIESFFGGGINSTNPLTGNISTTIKNSYVNLFCGGPKFGNMASGMTVTTEATGCTFGKYFGGGNGGTAIHRTRLKNEYQQLNYDWDSWISNSYNKTSNDNYRGKLTSNGVSVGYEYEFFGGSTGNVARLYLKFATFSLAQTNGVTSTLTDCTVNFDFYGGGNLAKVEGDATSTLNNCTIYGNVFGGGYSATIPKVYVRNNGNFINKPLYNTTTAVYEQVELQDEVEYTWTHVNSLSNGDQALVDDGDQHFIKTTEDITGLGVVTGHCSVTVTGNTYVEGLIDGEPIGGVFGGGDESSVGSSEVTIHTDMGVSSHPINNVYGGGNVAPTKGDATVTIEQGIIGQLDPVTNKVIVGTGNVYGGGRGRTLNPGETTQAQIDTVRNMGRVWGDTYVNIQGGQIRYNVYGGGKMASTGKLNSSGDYVSGGHAHVSVSGGEVGPLDYSGLNGYVYGGGQGVEIDYSNTYKNFANVMSTEVSVSNGTVWGSVFGGGADGHVMGNASVTVTGGRLGTAGWTSWDGNIFGGGRNYRASNYTAGRVGGNITVTMSGGKLMGSVFGGGRLGSTGVDVNGTMQPGDDHGHITVNISGGTVGNDDVYIINPDHENHYHTGDSIPYNNFNCIGNVYGGAKGSIIDLNLGQVKETNVTISNGTIRGSVHGGAEYGAVRGSELDVDGSGNLTKGNTVVNISGGTIGTIAYTRKKHTANDAPYDSIMHVRGGNVYAGGKGSTEYIDAGLVFRNATVNISGGHVYYSVYGGGEVSSIGTSGNLNTGLATVNITGGQVGPAWKKDDNYNIPIGLNGSDGYVFGGGQGIGDDPINAYKNFTNVNHTLVTIQMPDNDTVNNRIWGSVFGGAEDGHVLGNTEVLYKSGLSGTFGTTSYDGNIFGGGRNYLKKNYSAGRVGGNTYITMEGGTLYGSIFGGGRLGLVGVDVNAKVIEGDDYGKTTTIVKGGTVGNSKMTPLWTKSSIGDVYGGGKGSMKGIAGHPAASALLIALVKNTEVEISEQDPINHPTIIYGSVFGGGEVANVGEYTWDTLTVNGNPDIGNIRMKTDDFGNILGGRAKVTVSGGRIGADRMRMRHTLSSEPGHSYDLKYNDDVGHVFGGGEGLAADSAWYPTVNPGTLGGHNNRSLLNLMATVFYTDVTISGGWVKGSVYGGSENGHVLCDTYVKINGGQIGAGNTGNNNDDDVFYSSGNGTIEGPFFDPTLQEVNNTTSLYECAHWPYGDESHDGPYSPFDPVDIFNSTATPKDGKSWFGNVFGGGSGYYPYVDTVSALGDPVVVQTKWNRASGQVEGNTHVEITGGHILTSVYGGCEVGDVGIMNHTTGEYISGGNVTITMSGGTIGVPRTSTQFTEHPVTCKLYGAGKGDLRTYFNTWTNVHNSNIEMTGGVVYGSLYGGGEEGHVIKDASIHVSDNAKIGTTGYSALDGNIFGGGRGFGAEALTAGTVGGNTIVNFEGGVALGSVFGGGHNGSVGTHLVDVDNPNYGKMKHDVVDDPATPDVDESETHGHITLNITGGIIGNPYEHVEEPVGGNVFGGCEGSATSPLWKKLARAKQTEVHITGSPVIKGSVFGGPEQGTIVIDTIKDGSGDIVRLDGGNAHVLIEGGTIGSMFNTASAITGNDTTLHVGGSVFGGGKGVILADKDFSGIVMRNTTVDIQGGRIYYNIYGGGEMASVGLTRDSIASASGNHYHVPVKGTGIARVNFSGGELGPEAKPDGSIGLNGFDGYLFGGGKGYSVIRQLGENPAQVDTTTFLNTYRWYADVNKTVVHMSGGHVWGSIFGGAEDGHVLDSVYITFSDGTIGTHGISGYDGNIFSGGRNYRDLDPIVGRVGSNIITRMTGGTMYGSLYGGGRQGSVGVDDYGIMRMDSEDADSTYGETRVTIVGGIIGHDVSHGDPLIGGNVYGAGKGKAGKYRHAMVKDATVIISGNAVIKGSVLGGGEDAHVMGMTHILIGDTTAADGYNSPIGSGVRIGVNGIPGRDGNVYGGGRGDGYYLVAGDTTYSKTAGIVGESTIVRINNGQIRGSVYGGGRTATVGNEKALTYYSESAPFTPTDFGRTTVTITGGAIIGTGTLNNGHVFGGGKGNPEPTFDEFTNVHETFVSIKGNAQVRGMVFGGAEDGHVINYTTANGTLSGVAAAMNGDTHVFIEDNCVIGTADAFNSETSGSVYGGGRGLNKYKDNSGNQVANVNSGKVEGNTHVTILNGTIRNTVYGGSDRSVINGRKVVNMKGATVVGDIYGGSKMIEDSWRHTGLKTVNIHGGTISNTYGCGFKINDGDPDHPENYKRPTSFVNISGGHLTNSVYGAGQAGTVYGSVLVYIGKNAINHAPLNSYNIDSADLKQEMTYRNRLLGLPDPSGYAHNVSKINIEASVFAGSSYNNATELTTNWNTHAVKGYSNIYIDGTGYSMISQDDPGFENEDYMIISGNIFGSGTHCESGEMGRNITVRNYGDRNIDGNGWFTGSTRPMGTLQYADNLVIDHSNFTLTGYKAIEGGVAGKYAVYGIDTCFYVINGSGVTLGYEEYTADMDMIRKICSWHLQGSDGPSPTRTIYDQQFPSKFNNTTEWEWIGIREMNQKANKMYYVNAEHDDDSLEYSQENVLVFNKSSKLTVRYLDGGTPKYGELSGFFRMIANYYSPWGLESFAYARPKLTENTIKEDNLDDYGYNETNTSDGGFMSYNKKYNFYILAHNVPLNDDTGDGGVLHTKTSQYPYTNVLDTPPGGKGIDPPDNMYRLWVKGEFTGNRWYVDGTNGVDDMDLGRGLYPNKPKKTLTGTYGVYAGSKDKDGNAVAFQWVESGDGLDHHDKDVVYVVKPIKASVEKTASGATTVVNINADPTKGQLRAFRYPGGHTLYTGASTGYVYPDDPDPNNSTMLDVDTDSSVEVIVDEMLFDGLYGHIGLDNTYMDIPASYPAKADKPLILTHGGSKLTIKGNTNLQRGYNSTNTGADYMTNSDFGYSGSTLVPVTTAYGGALFVDENATVKLEGTPRISGNFQELANSSRQICNIFLPSFDKHIIISNALYNSALIGITNPVRNNDASYKKNTLSPIAVAVNPTHAETAWQNDNFYDDMDCFFGNGTGNELEGHTTYYKSGTIPNYEGTCTPANTLFFGWTWNNVVKSKPSTTSYEVSNSSAEIIVKDNKGLAWLISKVNGLNGQTKNSLADTTILLSADINHMDQYVWVPLGSENISTERFAGTFDGRGHLIKGISIDFIGKDDGRYEFTNYGLFGLTNGAVIDRTFVVDEYIKPDATGNMGGIVGSMQGDGSLISNSEAAVEIVTSDPLLSSNCGGLVGLLGTGQIHSSMAMSAITSKAGYIGGLVGTADGGNLTNSFANATFTVDFEDKEKVDAGGVIGVNTLAVVENCYSHIQTSTLPTRFGNITAINRHSIVKCYGDYYVNGVHENTIYSNEGMAWTVTDCGTYTAVTDPDDLGYLYFDNIVYLDEGTVKDTTLTHRLNQNAWALNNKTDSTYAHWARPTLSEINEDLPVLLLKEFDGGQKYQGSFSTVGTYNGGPVLQYGGTARDGSNNRLDGALIREKADDSKQDYLFVYGDIPAASQPTSNATLFKVSKVSIYEHASIQEVGTLADFENTYVGITFDNSFGKAYSSYGVVGPLVGVNEPVKLDRDWHTFSSPLANAPLGFDYQGHNEPVGTPDYNEYPHHSDASHYNNPWASSDENIYNPNPSLQQEFTWLNGGIEGNNRYWLNDNGYFPSQLGGFENGRGILEPAVQGINPYASDYGKYPYGMDFYSWFEPDNQWINFKRNGPNHWRSDYKIADEPIHYHVDYYGNPNDPSKKNENESELIPGKGYMGSICEETFLQSYGKLNAGTTTIKLLYTPSTTPANHADPMSKCSGWNLVGNPYHAYLDFNVLGDANSGILKSQSYVVYDADGFKYGTLPYPETAYLTYVVGGSSGGEYADRFIHPHQGFFVQTKEGGGNFGFVEANITKTRDDLITESQTSHLRGSIIETPAYPLLNLYLSSEKGCAEVTVVECYRPEWGGAHKMHELRNGNGSFWGNHDGKDYSALFVKEGATRVPIFFKAYENDVFTISWSSANGSFKNAWLVDNTTGERYNMEAYNSYEFIGSPADYTARFYIQFEFPDDDEFEDDGKNFAFFNGSGWVVNGKGKLELVDMLGHVLYHNNLSGTPTLVQFEGVAAGVYMLRLTSSNKVLKVQKIVIDK